MENLSFLIVIFAALATPLLMANFHISNLPTAVAEIVVGIILGQSFFNVIHVNTSLTQMSSLGVIILLFLSGMEIDFSLFSPKADGDKKIWSPLKIAIYSFAALLITAFLLGLLLQTTGLFKEMTLAALIFSTIALGVVIAALKEKELLSKPFGQTILLIAALGEVIPLVTLTIYATVHSAHPGRVWLISLIFLAAIFLLKRSKSIYKFFENIDKSTTQLDIRLAFFLIFALVSVAEQVGAENILGAFLAGIVMKLLRPKEETQDKLTSLGYGFFIPIFFIVTGAKLNIPGLFKDKSALILIPIFLVGFFLAKLPIYLVLKKRFKVTNAWAGTFLSTTTITLVLPALTVGRNLKLITNAQSGAFTIAAIIVCLIAPVLFNKFYQPEAEDMKKTSVHFIGANLITIPIAQQLTKGWYNVKLYTDKLDNYRTYNSEADITYLKELTPEALKAAGAFDTDIAVMAYADHKEDFRLSQWALAEKVPRIIARFESKNVADDQYDILAQQGVEVFNTFEANISMLRSMIESPATFKIITDTDSGLFEVIVHNRRFTGIELKNLPFVDKITIARIYRDKQFFAPHGDTEIHVGDHLIFTGNKAEISDIRQQLEKDN
ncbi:monovalent cation:proton antiporter family protein [Agrilactobacillus yilanensis]|uniref:Monovalent cation:proton antiporter family protein n=1 Tax=Agrilactobacillus yilanensis TaxID=2485997 RepID=A0ABW4J8B1_9LACO|nr:cation:proton antiporter family protein [Agrilactobacillus yilanensis]